MLEVIDLEAAMPRRASSTAISLTRRRTRGASPCSAATGWARRPCCARSAACARPVTTAGSIRFRGTDIAALATHEVARSGISIVPQGRRVFASLDVEENLRDRRGGGRRRRRGTSARVYDLFPRLRERARQRAGTLSGGEQQMLAIGRALMANPDLIVMDEPSEGLSPADRRRRSASGSATSATRGHGGAARRAERRPCAVRCRSRRGHRRRRRPLVDRARRTRSAPTTRSIAQLVGL